VTATALGDNLRPLGLEGGLVLDGAFGRLRSRAKLVEAGDQIGLFVKGCGQRIGLAYLGIIWDRSFALTAVSWIVFSSSSNCSAQAIPLLARSPRLVPTRSRAGFDHACEGYKATQCCKYSDVHFILKPRSRCVLSGALE